MGSRSHEYQQAARRGDSPQGGTRPTSQRKRRLRDGGPATCLLDPARHPGVHDPVQRLLDAASRAHAGLHARHPALVPAALAAYSIVGERVQGTLEPLLSTPVQERELVLGKALAVFLPSIAVAYAVFAFFIAIVELFAAPGVASGLVQAPDVVAQIVFTPSWSPGRSG